ncbi:tyrosine-type recombinase/integrase [Haladaptatus sp. NG-SE-30]
MTDPSNTENERATVAEAFGETTDPLADHAPTFESIPVDSFEIFVSEVLDTQQLAERTVYAYERLFEQWHKHMAREGRHPACPNERHVTSFVQHCQTVRGNQPDTVRTKLRRLSSVYEYWQQDPAFPHPPDYNPFTLVLTKLSLDRPPVKKPPRISLDELSSIVRSVTHVRDRAIIVSQLKLGLRATELCNMRIGDIHLDNREVQRGYPALGTHERLAGRSNAVYIPSRYERDGNKSRPRVLPLDDELQQILHHHLLTRPDTGAPWLFQTTLTHNQLEQQRVNAVWTDVFHPTYAEIDQHRAVTNHFGRHRFTTYWQVEKSINRERVKYMRGDTVEGELQSREGIDDYVHAYYEDIEQVYREHIYRFVIMTDSIP